MSELSAEDRAYLENVCDEPCFICERNQRLLALIDQQAKALEVADRLAEFAEDDAVSRAIVATSARAYRSTRTTTEGEGA